MMRGFTVNIEQFVPRDLESIREIEKSSNSVLTPYSLLSRYYTIPHGAFLVAKIENRVVGFIIANVDSGNDGHVLSIAVDPSYRKKGVGKALIEAIIPVLKGMGACRLRVELKTYNESAKRFYLRLSFRKSRIIKGYYQMPGYREDALEMFKELE